MTRRVFAYFLVVFFLIFSLKSEFIPVSFAQINDNSSGIAVYIHLLDKKVQEGDIISLKKNGYILSNIPYDPNIFGVVVKDPAIAFESDQSNSYPVVSEGKVFLRVSTANGKIKKGDLLTSSTIPGVGQKAVESGFIVATALEDYTGKNTGKILVVLNVGRGTTSTDTRTNLLKTFEAVIRSPYLSPLSVFRYVFAAIMVIVSFLIAVGYFGRISSLGIEAIGRNPLAGRIIIFSIVLHVLLALVIIAAGIGIAYLALVI